jgi:hypothetical protein
MLPNARQTLPVPLPPSLLPLFAVTPRLDHRSSHPDMPGANQDRLNPSPSLEQEGTDEKSGLHSTLLGRAAVAAQPDDHFL